MNVASLGKEKGIQVANLGSILLLHSNTNAEMILFSIILSSEYQGEIVIAQPRHLIFYNRYLYSGKQASWPARDQIIDLPSSVGT